MIPSPISYLSNRAVEALSKGMVEMPEDLRRELDSVGLLGRELAARERWELGWRLTDEASRRANRTVSVRIYRHLLADGKWEAVAVEHSFRGLRDVTRGHRVVSPYVAVKTCRRALRNQPPFLRTQASWAGVWEGSKLVTFD